MPRLALKPDSSFFRKITLGTIGARRVAEDLGRRGHLIYELERGSLDTKLWKGVKRKRVRMPDLVCGRCGVRVESRAKAKPELSMSHSLTDAERAWDFGMVNSDWIAFPVCASTDERLWAQGRLGSKTSYWHERNWVEWQTDGAVNYFTVQAFRAAAHATIATKGVTEGSETTLSWAGAFSARNGTVEVVDGRRLTIRRDSDGHRHTRRLPSGFDIFVAVGDVVQQHELVAGGIRPLATGELRCPGRFPADHLPQLLASRERTQRFAGVKLARLTADPAYRQTIARMALDSEEDVYIRLEAASYLAAVCDESAGRHFRSFLDHRDPQIQLEAVIALGETDTPESVELLAKLLDDNTEAYFLRSAAAWALSRTGAEAATARLIKAFTDVDLNIREEALQGVVTLGGAAIPLLAQGLRAASSDVAAGCAEALRQHEALPDGIVDGLADYLSSGTPSRWAVWLAGHLPRTRVAGAIAGLEKTAPQLHFAITLLWAFAESWIARRWELNAGAIMPAAGVVDDLENTL